MKQSNLSIVNQNIKSKLKGEFEMTDDLQTLIGKILADENFAQALAENPERTLEEAGIEPNIDLVEALKGVDAQALKNLAAAFGENQAAV
jgi:hypothetical protein